MQSRRARRGSALIEFTLVGIMFLFIWIGIVQMAIGMWRYHTLQYAVKETGAYVSVHGLSCTLQPNSCAIQIKDAAQVLRNLAFSIPATTMNVTFTALAADRVTEVSHVSCRLDACLTDTTAWPPAGSNASGKDFTVKADYLFQSSLSMVAPGQEPMQFGTFRLSGYTHQVVVF
jgi:Flp pilus assembly protein TadG